MILQWTVNIPTAILIVRRIQVFYSKLPVRWHQIPYKQFASSILCDVTIFETGNAIAYRWFDSLINRQNRKSQDSIEIFDAKDMIEHLLVPVNSNSTQSKGSKQVTVLVHFVLSLSLKIYHLHHHHYTIDIGDCLNSQLVETHKNLIYHQQSKRESPSQRSTSPESFSNGTVSQA